MIYPRLSASVLGLFFGTAQPHMVLLDLPFASAKLQCFPLSWKSFSIMSTAALMTYSVQNNS